MARRDTAFTVLCLEGETNFSKATRNYPHRALKLARIRPQPNDFGEALPDNTPSARLRALDMGGGVVCWLVDFPGNLSSRVRGIKASLGENKCWLKVVVVSNDPRIYAESRRQFGHKPQFTPHVKSRHIQSPGTWPHQKPAEQQLLKKYQSDLLP